MLPTATKPLVLIADDNRDTREMYASYLPIAGYAVETATDGREAVIKALSLYPDVVVMDLKMPGVDGWRAMREIRGNARTATTPIIVLTGHDFKDYLSASALAEGAWSYLVKPCSPERLAQEITARLDGYPLCRVHAIRGSSEVSAEGGDEERRRRLIRVIAAHCPVQLHVGPSAGASCMFCGHAIAAGALQYDIATGRSTIIVDDDCYQSSLRAIVEAGHEDNGR